MVLGIWIVFSVHLTKKVYSVGETLIVEYKAYVLGYVPKKVSHSYRYKNNFKLNIYIHFF
jgi:hypothetical protein